ncbi:MAG: hypothetical protein D4R64_13430 [Porphyromonadaceae bacterium]|nr:MAG: hypothetical protein D4R64_13430 [Porphyromonadaceae bacterium]
MVTPSQRDIIRSTYVLSEFQKNGTVSKRRCHPSERKLSGRIGLLMEQFLLHLESLRRSKITIRDHRLYLHRFLAFMESKQIMNVEEIKEEDREYLVRTECKGTCSSVFKAVGVALPPTIRLMPTA